MQHLTDGQLRAYLDGESCEGSSLSVVNEHIAHCQECLSRFERMEKQAAFLRQQLGFLLPVNANEAATSTDEHDALAKFRNRMKKKEISEMSKEFLGKLRPAWAVLAFVVILATLFSFPSGRIWAGQFLGLFRVQQIRVLPIDTDILSQNGVDTTLGKQLGAMISKSTTVRKEPVKSHIVANAQEASKEVSFGLRLPAGQPIMPTIAVQGGSAFDVVVDRTRTQSLLDEFGRKDLILPETLDGAVISVDIPIGINAAYGDCPDLIMDKEQKANEDTQSKKVHFPDCIILTEVPSPTVKTPPDLDLAKLAQVGLEFAGMKAEEARAFTEGVDWTSSLVIPIPKQDSTVEQITLDGVNGSLVKHSDGYIPRYVLIWVKDGIVYALNGWGTDPAKAIEMANSLQ
jgi:hypothetical protein